MDRLDIEAVEQFNDICRNLVDRQHHILAGRTSDSARVERDHAMIDGELTSGMRLPDVEREACSLQQDDRNALTTLLVIEIDARFQFHLWHRNFLRVSGEGIECATAPAN